MSQVFEGQRGAEAYGFWRAARGDNPVPHRRDMRPEAMTALLPFIYVVDITAAQFDLPAYTLRLMGGALSRGFNRDLVGRRVEDLPFGGWQKALSQSLQVCYRTALPVVGTNRLDLPGTGRLRLEHLALPMRDDVQEVSRIFGVLDFLEANRDRANMVLTEIIARERVSYQVEKRILIERLDVETPG